MCARLIAGGARGVLHRVCRITGLGSRAPLLAGVANAQRRCPAPFVSTRATGSHRTLRGAIPTVDAWPRSGLRPPSFQLLSTSRLLCGRGLVSLRAAPQPRTRPRRRRSCGVHSHVPFCVRVGEQRFPALRPGQRRSVACTAPCARPPQRSMVGSARRGGWARCARQSHRGGPRTPGGSERGLGGLWTGGLAGFPLGQRVHPRRSGGGRGLVVLSQPCPVRRAHRPFRVCVDRGTAPARIHGPAGAGRMARTRPAVVGRIRPEECVFAQLVLLGAQRDRAPRRGRSAAADLARCQECAAGPTRTRSSG